MNSTSGRKPSFASSAATGIAACFALTFGLGPITGEAATLQWSVSDTLDPSAVLSDGLGLFGAVGVVYTSGTITQTWILDTANLGNVTPVGEGGYTNQASASNLSLTDSVSFNGKTVSYLLTGSATVELWDGVTGGLPAVQDLVNIEVSGSTSNGISVGSDASDTNYSTPLGLSLSFLQSWSHTTVDTDATGFEFNASNASASTGVEAFNQVSSLCLNGGCIAGGGTPVPLPANVWLMASALGGLLAVARRKRAVDLILAGGSGSTVRPAAR
jgi:hypothetical protein